MTVNGEAIQYRLDPETPLLFALRETIRNAVLFPDQPAKRSLSECRQMVIDAAPYCEKERYNVQREIAQILWMLRRIDEPMAFSLAAELRNHDYGDHWQRWLNEAVTTSVPYKPVIPKPGTRPAGK